MELRSNGFCYGHSHHHDIYTSDLPIVPVIGEVRTLTEEECYLLDAIKNNDYRYTVYNTPGKLIWGVGLKVGDNVLAQLPNRENFAAATIRFAQKIGKIGQRHIFGVEITVSLFPHHLNNSWSDT